MTSKTIVRTDGRVFWSDEEWQNILLSLVQLFPGKMSVSPSSGELNLDGITYADIREAQNVLSEHRRRKGQIISKDARLKMLDIYNANDNLRSVVSKALLAFEENESTAERQGVSTEKVQPSSDAKQEEHKEEEEQSPFSVDLEKAAEAIAKSSNEEAKTVEPEINPYELAFGPIVRLVAGEVAKSMAPMVLPKLAEALIPHMRSLLDEMFQPKSKTVQAELEQDKQPTPHNPQPTLPEFVERRHKPRVGVIGGNSRTHNQLKNEYPCIDFVSIYYKGPDVVDKLKNCDVGMVLTDKCSHTLTDLAKKSLGDKLRLITGGSSNARRQIEIWIGTKAIRMPIKTEAHVGK